ncbi:MAG: undecaprenyl-diphosphate phosphatase [Treponema sp.]|nr:undecaprenyl-diphosphate phosphatase [Treponema sp.]
MNIFEAIFLGAVQGLTEFLPVSSSGHLVLARVIFGIDAGPILFETAVHIGTLAAVIAALRREIWDILKNLAQPVTAFLVVATIPAVAAALLLRGWLEGAAESGNYLGFAFLATAALLSAAELISRRAVRRAELRGREEMSWRDALVIGACQALAVVPGVSRSGATLAGALARGLGRDFGARFVFLLSIPIILGAGLFQAVELMAGSESAAEAARAVGSGALVAGTLSAAIVGFFAVRIMLKIVREKSLWGFAVYTGALGAFVLLDRFALRIFF